MAPLDDGDTSRPEPAARTTAVNDPAGNPHVRAANWKRQTAIRRPHSTAGCFGSPPSRARAAPRKSPAPAESKTPFPADESPPAEASPPRLASATPCFALRQACTTRQARMRNPPDHSPAAEAELPVRVP